MELSRRAFLKSLATIVAGSFVPVEIATINSQAIATEIKTILDNVITVKNPAAYIILNDKKIPILDLTLVQSFGGYERFYMRDGNDHRIVGSRKGEPELPTIDIKLFNVDDLDYICRIAGKIYFTVQTGNLKFKGEGYITQHYYNSYTIKDEFPDCGIEILCEDYLRLAA